MFKNLKIKSILSIMVEISASSEEQAASMEEMTKEILKLFGLIEYLESAVQKFIVD